MVLDFCSCSTLRKIHKLICNNPTVPSPSPTATQDARDEEAFRRRFVGVTVCTAGMAGTEELRGQLEIIEHHLPLCDIDKEETLPSWKKHYFESNQRCCREWLRGKRERRNFQEIFGRPCQKG